MSAQKSMYNNGVFLGGGGLLDMFREVLKGRGLVFEKNKLLIIFGSRCLLFGTSFISFAF